MGMGDDMKEKKRVISKSAALLWCSVWLQRSHDHMALFGSVTKYYVLPLISSSIKYYDKM